MRLDPDLARSLLLKIEVDLNDHLDESEFSSEEDYKKYYHIKKLVEAGYLRGQPIPSDDEEHEYISIYEITYAGHLFLETIRDDALWQRTKDGGRKLGSFSFEIAQELASGYLKTQLKKWTSVDFE